MFATLDHRALKEHYVSSNQIDPENIPIICGNDLSEVFFKKNQIMKAKNLAQCLRSVVNQRENWSHQVDRLSRSQQA